MSSPCPRGPADGEECVQRLAHYRWLHRDLMPRWLAPRRSRRCQIRSCSRSLRPGCVWPLGIPNLRIALADGLAPEPQFTRALGSAAALEAAAIAVVPLSPLVGLLPTQPARTRAMCASPPCPSSARGSTVRAVRTLAMSAARYMPGMAPLTASYERAKTRVIPMPCICSNGFPKPDTSDKCSMVYVYSVV